MFQKGLSAPATLCFLGVGVVLLLLPTAWHHQEVFPSFSAAHKALREVLEAAKNKVLIHSSREGAVIPKNPEFGTSKVIMRDILELGHEPQAQPFYFCHQGEARQGCKFTLKTIFYSTKY